VVPFTSRTEPRRFYELHARRDGLDADRAVAYGTMRSTSPTASTLPRFET